MCGTQSLERSCWNILRVFSFVTICRVLYNLLYVPLPVESMGALHPRWVEERAKQIPCSGCDGADEWSSAEIRALCADESLRLRASRDKKLLYL